MLSLPGQYPTEIITVCEFLFVLKDVDNCKLG